jgi:LysR family hydrogen peroxide-inducible transcriptional activator
VWLNQKLEEKNSRSKLSVRRSAGSPLTPLGEEIVRQAQSVLNEPTASARSPGARTRCGSLRLGVIYTIGPYLLPDLGRPDPSKKTPQMPLMLRNFTVRLLEELRTEDRLRHIQPNRFPTPAWRCAALRRTVHGRRAERPSAGRWRSSVPKG